MPEKTEPFLPRLKIGGFLALFCKLDQIRTDFEVIVRKSARNRGTDHSWRGKTALELACSIGKVEIRLAFQPRIGQAAAMSWPIRVPEARGKPFSRPNIRADFLAFALKSVKVWPKLPVL